LEFGNVGFWGDGKTGVPREKLLRARRRTNNNLNPHIGIRESNPGHTGRGRVLSPLCHLFQYFVIP